MATIGSDHVLRPHCLNLACIAIPDDSGDAIRVLLERGHMRPQTEIRSELNGALSAATARAGFA